VFLAVEKFPFSDQAANLHGAHPFHEMLTRVILLRKAEVNQFDVTIFFMLACRQLTKENSGFHQEARPSLLTSGQSHSRTTHSRTSSLHNEQRKQSDHKPPRETTDRLLELDEN
jgi:hypothetical protein